MTRLAVSLAGAMALGAAVLAAPAQAAEEYVFDEGHTFILFDVSHLGFSRTHGQFRTFEGTFMLDREEPANSSVTMVIDAASLDTRHEARDAHLRNADFFNVEAYPEITFVSTDVELTGEATALVTGDLTMLGVTRPVTLDVTLNQLGEHPMNGNTVAGFTATTTLNRSDFGMTSYVPAVGDDVAILIQAEASPADEVM